MFKISITEFSLKIKHVKSQPHLPGDGEWSLAQLGHIITSTKLQANVYNTAMTNMKQNMNSIMTSTDAFSTLLALCEGNPPVTGGFPSQSASNMNLRCSFVVILNKWLNKHSIDR